MYQIGLVSVSFRGLSPEEIIRIAKDAGLSRIEWGSDVHAPPVSARRGCGAALTEHISCSGEMIRLC